MMERLIGPFDGATREFNLSNYYVLGSVRAFWPTLQRQADVTELGQNRIELGEAPEHGDVVFIYYREV